LIFAASRAAAGEVRPQKAMMSVRQQFRDVARPLAEWIRQQTIAG
jgi:hypothetical protein